MPYPAGYENGPAQKDLQAQAEKVVANLKLGAVKADPDKEIIALIAYLQRLGTDIKSAPAVPDHRAPNNQPKKIMEQKILSSLDGVEHLWRHFHSASFSPFSPACSSWAFGLKKNYLHHMGDLPLDGGEKNSTDKNQSSKL